MKKFDVCGLGNALVDLLFECSESQFQALKMDKGGMRLIDSATQKSVLAQLGMPVRMASGGSVANSVAMVGQLGGRAALLCSLGLDQHGEFFKNDLSEMGVETNSAATGKSSQETGTSLVVVTPDAERSMSTSLGACTDISPDHIEKKLVADSRWVFIEGYVIANSDQARNAIKTLIAYAKESNTKIALTLSDAFVVNVFGDFVKEILPQTDLVFCNDTEATALTGESDVTRAFEKLQTQCKGVVVTAGSKGAHVAMNGVVGHVASFACTPVDLTGAGDAFAGAFLHGICSELSPFDAVKKGCFYASKVIQQWGARLRADMPALHKELCG